MLRAFFKKKKVEEDDLRHRGSIPRREVKMGETGEWQLMRCRCSRAEQLAYSPHCESGLAQGSSLPFHFFVIFSFFFTAAYGGLRQG